MRNKEILIIEDDTSTAEIFKNALELFGYKAQCVYDWNNVPKILSINHFGLVLMDINLNGISGLTLLQNIKSSQSFTIANTKFAAVSGYSKTDQIGIEASKLFDFYLEKPVDLDKLNNILDSIEW